MKNYFKILAILVVIVGVLAIAQNFIMKNIVVAAVQNLTGTKAEVGGFYISFLKQKVSIRDFVLYNPPGFPEGPLVNIPEITVALDVPALMKKTLHLPTVTLNLKEAVIVRDKEGKLNVDNLKFAKQPQDGKKQENMPFLIDHLYLTLGQVVVKDYRQGLEPKVVSYNLDVRNKHLENINSPQQLASIILVQVMAPTAFKSAAIYGIATALSMSVLPVGVAGVLIGNDAATAVFTQNPDKIYSNLLAVVKARGSNVVETQRGKTMKATIDGCSVIAQVEKVDGATRVSVSARKILIPRPEIAEGIIFQLKEKVK